MLLNIHFISGLPRAGSTLLSALLRQNPSFRACISGPLAGVFWAVRSSMSAGGEASVFLSDDKRQRVLRAVVEAYYAEIPDGTVVFDTNRSWCAAAPALACLFPNARLICCVRNLAWILDSFERITQRNMFQQGKLFPEGDGNVYDHVNQMMQPKGQVGHALNALRHAWFGESAGRLVAVRYESLTERPEETMEGLYEAIGEPFYPHDFEHVEYDEPEYDARLGVPGLHRVSGRVEPRERKTILPPDLFSEHDREFWTIPGQNPRGVLVL